MTPNPAVEAHLALRGVAKPELCYAEVNQYQYCFSSVVCFSCGSIHSQASYSLFIPICFNCNQLGAAKVRGGSPKWHSRTAYECLSRNHQYILPLSCAQKEILNQFLEATALGTTLKFYGN